MENDQTEGTMERPRPNRLLCPLDHCDISFRDWASAQLVDVKRPCTSANMTRSHLLDSHLDQLSFPERETVISEETCCLMSSVWWEQIPPGAKDRVVFISSTECLSQEENIKNNVCDQILNWRDWSMTVGLFVWSNPTVRSCNKPDCSLVVRSGSGLSSGYEHG